MQTLRYLLRTAGPRAVLLAPLGVLGAACSGALMAVVHRALTAGELGMTALAAFVGFGAGRIATAYLSSAVLGSHAARSVAAMRAEIVARLLRVPFRHLERTGRARLLSALTSDVSMLESAIGSIPAGLSALAMLVGGSAYLVYLSWKLFVLLLMVVLVCLLVFRWAASHAHSAYLAKRAAHDRLWELYGALTGGLKELKQHAPRRTDFVLGPLRSTTEALREHELSSTRRYALSGAINQALVLMVLGLVLFALPEGSALRAEVSTGYVLVGLYMMSPLATLSRLWPTFRHAEVALLSLDALGVKLRDAPDELEVEPLAQPRVRSVELRGARFRYEGSSSFGLGPLTLTLTPGEVLFVVGGNGSGKTTLGRLLCGLYAPDEGELFLDDRSVGHAALDAYRQLWSAVFTDAQLFDQLYGLERAGLDARASSYIERLGLRDVIDVQDGVFNTLQLSQGQRKRVALLVALLEDRPLYLFDEWAADQDPDWKHWFYRELLPELRARGKAVVVITHDDRYFDAADRTLVLRDGLLEA